MKTWMIYSFSFQRKGQIHFLFIPLQGKDEAGFLEAHYQRSIKFIFIFAVTQIHCVHNTHISLSESPLWDKEDTKTYHEHEGRVVHYAMATK